MPDERRPQDVFAPQFAEDPDAWRLCAKWARELARPRPAENGDTAWVEEVRTKALAAPPPEKGKGQDLRVCVSVLCDLRAQGWSLQVLERGIRLVRPERNSDDAKHETCRVRAAHAIERDAQLRQRSVRRFIGRMERRILGPKGWVSIFSLMRDGRELAENLRAAAQEPELAQRLVHLRAAVDPYLQVVQDTSICKFTGLKLSEVWRYFRHTWANAYRTVPGRNMLILVRDRAVENHPVMGIAALTSPVVHLTIRDRWLGWAPKQFVASLRARPTAAWARWVQDSLTTLIGEVYIDDLIADGIVRRADVSDPSEDCVRRLADEARAARSAHAEYPDKRIHKNPPKDGETVDWRGRGETQLFRSKRADGLSSLLEACRLLKQAGFTEPTRDALRACLQTAGGRRAVETIRRHVKAIHVGNQLLDISICGAIPPYNAILGGKLVAMLLTSPEIVRAYKDRYATSPSIIASSMAARPILRAPRLVTLTTTSLYGSSLSQYTRIAIPASECGGDTAETVRYKKLGLTKGQGSYHFSHTTVAEIQRLLSHAQGGRRVNSIFGEGVNPRMRKIRDGLDLCGFPTDHVLQHGTPRVVYGVALATNFREVLTGRAKHPRYILPQEEPEPVTQAIADFWRRRWLAPRIDRPEIIEAVRKHTLVYPIEHGARVVLPFLQDEAPLWQDLHE